MSESFEVNVGPPAEAAPPVSPETPPAAPPEEETKSAPPSDVPRSISLPLDEADEGAWNDLYTQLGRPETAEAYGLAAALEGTAMTAMDEAFLGNMSAAMHKAGLSTKQAVALTRACNNEFRALIESQNEEYEKSLAEAREMFPPQTIEKAIRVMKAAGLDKEARQDIERALGPRRAIELFSAASAVLEDKMPAASGAVSGGSPEAVRARIDQLMSDENFVARYMRGDESAVRQMEELSKMAV